jgi:hypothetical protein
MQFRSVEDIIWYYSLTPEQRVQIDKDGKKEEAKRGELVNVG